MKHWVTIGRAFITKPKEPQVDPLQNLQLGISFENILLVLIVKGATKQIGLLGV